MLRIIARLSRIAFSIPRKSPFTKVIPALSIATSVPVPIAMPTSAAASAGASLMPSPAMATIRPCSRNSRTRSFLRCGSTPASTSSMPNLLATALAVRSLSPVSMMTLIPSSCRCLIASGVDSLIGSETARIPAAFPLIPTKITVCPSA